jgi:hypothetical protein
MYAYNILVKNPEGKRTRTRPGQRWEDIRMDLSRNSSVGIATDYGLDDRVIGVRFLAGAGNFSLHHRVQTGSGAHPASYPMGTEFSFPGGKVVEA